MPQDDGLRRSTRCPPAHPLKASPSHHVQASARTARPSGPLTRSPALMGKVSPIFNQWGRTKYSPPATSTMGGEYSPTAAPPMPSARASPFDRSAKGRIAPSPARHEAAMPSRPPHHDQQMGGGQLPSAPTMAGNLTRQTCESACLASGIHFHSPLAVMPPSTPPCSPTSSPPRGKLLLRSPRGNPSQTNWRLSTSQFIWITSRRSRAHSRTSPRF